MKRILLGIALSVLVADSAGARTIDISGRQVSRDGVIQSVDLSFGVAGETETNRLFAVWGKTVGGASPTSWDARAEVAVIPPERTDYTCAMPTGWDSSVRAIRFYLVPKDLPYDEVVTYIESTGKEYISTDCTHTPTTRIDTLITLSTPTVGSYNVPFGSRASSSLKYEGALYVFTRYNGKSTPGFARGDAMTSREAFGGESAMPAGKTYSMTVEGQRLSWSSWGTSTTNALTFSGAANTKNGFAPMTIFTLNETGTGGGVTANTACNTKMRLYTFTMTDGGTVLCDLLPVKKDGVGYLYDRVSHTLKGNLSGEGAFIVSTEPLSFDEQSATASEVLDLGTERQIAVAATNIVAGVATSLELAISPSSDVRTNVLYAAYGKTVAGDGPEGWAHFDRVAQVPPGMTTYTYALPAGWGEDVKVLRFFLAARPAEDYDSVVEYLESTGQEWVNTGARHAASTTINCVADILSETVGSYNVPFGSRRPDNSHGIYFFTRYGGRMRVGYTFGKGEKFADSLALPLDRPLRFRVDGLMGSLYTNDVRFAVLQAPKVSGDAADYSGDGPVLVFTMNETSTAGAVSPNTACKTRMRLRSFTMYNDLGKTTMCDLVPVVKDGTGYLYDRVGGRLLGNGSGSGAFILGPACYGGERIRAVSAVVSVPADEASSPRFRFRSQMAFRGHGGTRTVAGVPVEVAISPNRISGFDYTQCAVDGSDIRFFSPEGDLLPHEIDTWNPAGTSIVWVRVPALSAVEGTRATMCWGATSRAPAARPVADVWSDYLAVWHFNEESGTARDSGPFGLHAEPRGDAVNSVGVDGLTQSRVRQVNGGWFEAPACDGVFLGSAFAASGWFHVTSYTSGQSSLLFSTKTLYNDSHGWYLAIQERPDWLSINGGGGDKSDTAFIRSYPNLTAKWRHVVGTYDGKSATVYGFDDSARASRIETFSLCAPQESADTLKLLHDTYGSYVGYVEELRIRRGRVDAEWVNAEYAAMSETFASFGSAEKLIRQGTMVLIR